MYQLWNAKDIKREIKKLKIPKKFIPTMVDIDVFLNHDTTMLLSIREDAGKTTQHLILGLVLNKLYGAHILYQRCDKEQITVGNVGTLFKTLIEHGYISEITDGRWNDIVYKNQQHKFYFAKRTEDENGHVAYELSDDFLCHAICLENHILYKSGSNDPHADYMLFDECFDTSRSTARQMIELSDNISTFLRPFDRMAENEQGEMVPVGHVIMLGNNTNMYSQWFEEFCIEEDIPNLKFGSYIDRKTALGTTFACYLIAQSDELKDRVQSKKIHFFGYNTPKMNAFNGLQEWQTSPHQHLLYDEQLKESELVSRRLHILHRNRCIRLDVYKNNELGMFLFAHYNKLPSEKDVVLTLSPNEKNHIYGFGEFAPKSAIRIGCARYLSLIRAGQIYFSSNSVGDLFENYCTEAMRRKNYI